MKCNYNVITKLKCNYFVITKWLLYYIVITFCRPVWALTFDTPLAEGRLVYGHLLPDEHLFVQESYLNIGKDDELFEITPNTGGRFVLGIPQDATQLSLTISDSSGSKTIDFPVSARKWDEEIVTGLPPKKVSPNPADQARITAEALEMRTIRQKSIFPGIPEKWALPVPDFRRISSRFGSRRVLNNIKKQGHSGTDFAAPIGTPVVAPAAGRVVYINPDVFLTGQTVMVDHGGGVFSSYSHLNDIKVKLNQDLKIGDSIGSVGQTGRATGPHLHFTVTWYGVRVNPEDLLPLPDEAKP